MTDGRNATRKNLVGRMRSSAQKEPFTLSVANRKNRASALTINSLWATMNIRWRKLSSNTQYYYYFSIILIIFVVGILWEYQRSRYMQRTVRFQSTLFWAIYRSIELPSVQSKNRIGLNTVQRIKNRQKRWIFSKPVLEVQKLAELFAWS